MTDVTFRPPTDADIPQILALRAHNAAEIGVPSGAQEADIRLAWTAPGITREHNFVVAEVGGSFAGHGGFQTGDGRARWDGAVVAEHRARGVGTALLRWGIERIRGEVGITEVFTGADSSRADALALFSSLGFEHVRSFFRMIHPTPASAPEPSWPDGIRLETGLRGDEQKRAIIEAYDSSFIDHWNFHAFDPDEYDHMTTHPDVSLDLLLLAFDGDRPVGLNLCFMEERDTHTHGTVGVLGTVRGYRGIGLGTALLNHGVRELAARGATQVELGVDAENQTGALGLYERNGFGRANESRAYRLTLS